MLINKIFLILIILIFLVVILEYFYNNNDIESFMSIIGPVIKPIEKIVYKPTNTYYENNKITQDFDSDGVLQDYNPNSIIIQEEKGYVLTN